MKKILIFAIIKCICTLTIAQTFIVESTPTLDFLYTTNYDIGLVSNTEKQPIFSVIVGNNHSEIKLIKNRKGLYALVDGTGQVYKATNLVDNKVTFTRIDSTKFFGHNYGAINFSYKDVLYSFGGYGFWHIHGQLSSFTEGNEWSIEKINKEYRTIYKYFSYNPKSARLYYIEFPRVEENTKEVFEETSVIEFDIKNKKNKIVGLLNPKLNFNWRYFSINTPSLNGIISYDSGEIFLFQFSENKIYKLINNEIKHKLGGKAGTEIINTFEHNGIIYYSYSNDTTLRKLPIRLNDFVLVDYPIYSTVVWNNNYWIVLIISGFAILLILILIYKKNSIKGKTIQIQEEQIYNPDLSSNEFNDIEISIINKLIEKSNNNSYLNVDEFNAFLGIKKKTIEIQKRVRTEAINRINHKFNVKFNVETVFIERVRSNEDRRYFNYKINNENSILFKNRNI